MNITGGKYNSINANTPDSKVVRPTLSKVRAGVFNSLASIMEFEGKNFLDCFGGSGIMSLEAVSRGFKKVVTVEKDFKTAEIIKNNFISIKETPILLIKDIIKALDIINEEFDVIYIDPPYKNTSLYEDTLEKICEKAILKPDGIILVECKANEKDIVIPDLLYVTKEKKYGDTKIIFLKRADKSNN